MPTFVLKIVIYATLACFVAVPAAAKEQALTPHSAEYKVKISLLSGKLRTRLIATDTGYEATHRVDPSGMAKMFTSGIIEESSGFTIVPEGVLPQTYESVNTISRDKERASIVFDWDTGAVTGTFNDEPVEDVLESLAHDRVSIQYELMRDLMNGDETSDYILFDVDRLRTLNVTHVGTKEVKTPAGKFEAIGIRHQAEGSSRATTLWCAEELDYLPVLIERHRKGKLQMRATLRAYTPEPVTPEESTAAAPKTLMP